MGRELIVHKDPKSPISEIFRTLRTNIQFMNTKGKLKTILITSTLPGEGKSWVSSNLGITFAQAGKKVILVDADMRKGRQYSIFGTAPVPGLSNYLSGIDYNTGEELSKELIEYIQETKIPNLYLMPAGNIPPNPSELLISERMIELLERLKSICDIVIIDGLPSLLVADSLILTRIVDSTVIVTACKQTKKDDLRQVINNIKNVGGKISGVVLNKVPISAKDYEKSYYYGNSNRFEEMKKLPKRKNSASIEKRKSARNNNVDEIRKRAEHYEAIKKRTANDLMKNRVVKESESKSNVEIKKDKEENVLNREIKIENSNEISTEKTQEIMQQINKYIEKEKQNLK